MCIRDSVKAEYGGVDQQCGRHDIVQQYVEDASAAAFGTGPTVVHHQEKHRAGEGLEKDQRIDPDMLDPTPFEPEDIGRGEEDSGEQPQRYIGEERSEDARTQPHHDVVDEPLVAHGTATEQQRQGRQDAEGDERRLAGEPLFQTSPCLLYTSRCV